MPVPSRRLKELIEGTVDHHASQRWPALEEVTISWRGSYGYLTGYLSEDDDDTIKLCRIQYLGDDTEWAFAIWQASSDSYTNAVLLDGHRTGHPNQALDTACTLYLASPGDEPAEPLKDLRGAALVVLPVVLDALRARLSTDPGRLDLCSIGLRVRVALSSAIRYYIRVSSIRYISDRTGM